MKRILLFAFLAIASASFASEIPVKHIKIEKFFKTVHVNYTLTSTGGCTVHIVGDVTFSIIPPSFDGFSGTVSISGGKNCPNGSMTFAARVSCDEYGNVTGIDWGMEAGDILSLLTETGIDHSIKDDLSALVQ